MPSIDAGGTELHYLRAGSGEPMLLIQGMSATHMAGVAPSSLRSSRGDLRMLGAAMASGDREQVLRAMWEINLSPAFRDEESRYAEFRRWRSPCRHRET